MKLVNGQQGFDTLWKNYCPEISCTIKDCSYPNVAAQALKEISKRIGKKIFFSFLWNGKPDPITRHNSYLKLESGGISMINIEKFISALKVAWVRRIVHNVEKTWHKVLRRTYRDIIYIQNFGPHFLKRQRLYSKIGSGAK